MIYIVIFNNVLVENIMRIFVNCFLKQMMVLDDQVKNRFLINVFMDGNIFIYRYFEGEIFYLWLLINQVK